MQNSIPSIISKKYRVIQEIGRGGMGSVYLVKHLYTGDYSALKLLHSQALISTEAIDRFKREMRLPAKIRSEHVVKITDADTAPELGNAPYLVMELLQGFDLSHLIMKGGARSGAEVLWILHEIARALDKAHTLGIVHRDLKPDNLFIHRREDESLIVKILDFGIAKVTQDLRNGSNRAITLNKDGIIGTPLYMAPEQAKGQEPEGPEVATSADIWAIGMIAFELLTGNTYWRGETTLQVLSNVLFAEMTPPSRLARDLPQEFDAWFLKSCARQPNHRWATATEQLQELMKALGQTEVPNDPPNTLSTAVAQLAPPALQSYATWQPGQVPAVALAPTLQAREPLVFSQHELVESTLPARELSASPEEMKSQLDPPQEQLVADSKAPIKFSPRLAAAAFALLVFICALAWVLLRK